MTFASIPSTAAVAAPAIAAELPPATLADLESGCRALAQARGDLAARLVELNAEMEALRQRYAPDVIAALRHHNTLHELLVADIKRVPAQHFTKPRTVQFHGIKVGLAKSPGAMVFSYNDADTIALIEKHFPDQVGALVQTKRTPKKEGLEALPATDLAKVGATLVNAGDRVVCAPVDGDVEKLIKALAKSASGLIDPKAEQDAGEGA